MAAPKHVPSPAEETARVYTSPPRRPSSWMAVRPGDLDGRQPAGDRLGSQGPDQGYALTLAEQFRPKLVLHRGEHADDALAGAVAVALKRASIFGRAPVIHDLTVALSIWGFLDEAAPKDLVQLRHRLFEEVHHPHAYSRLRAIPDLVPADVLAQPHQAILDQAHDNWRSVIDPPAS
jgi:hypothetical protein